MLLIKIEIHCVASSHSSLQFQSYLPSSWLSLFLCVRTNSTAESVFVVCVYMVSGQTTLHWTANKGAYSWRKDQTQCLMVSETCRTNPVIGYLRTRNCCLLYDFWSFIFHQVSQKPGLAKDFHALRKLRKFGCNQTGGRWPTEMCKVTLQLLWPVTTIQVGLSGLWTILR